MRRAISVLLLTLVLSSSLSTFANASSETEPEATPTLTDNESIVYNALKSEGYSDASIAGVLGNLQQESGLNPLADNGSGHVGIVQWGDNRLAGLKNCANWQDISVQVAYMIEEAGTGVWVVGNLEDFKKCTDPIKAAEWWCVSFEKCTKSLDGTVVTENNYASLVSVTTSLTDQEKGTFYSNCRLTNDDVKNMVIASYQSTLNGDCFLYQDLKSRSSKASDYYTKITGSNFVVNDSKTVIQETRSVMNMLEIGVTKYTMTDTALELPDDSGLTTTERMTIADWKADIESRNSNGKTNWIRALVVFIGILLIVYMMLLYVSFQLDNLLSFLPFNILSLLTFGKIQGLYDEESTKSFKKDGVRYVTHRLILTICICGVILGLFLVSGKVYDLVGYIIYRFQ